MAPLPIITAAIMDTERIIPQNGSPGSQNGPHSGSGSGPAIGHPGDLPPNPPQYLTSIPRKKKTERQVPPAPINHSSLMDSPYLNSGYQNSYANTPPVPSSYNPNLGQLGGGGGGVTNVGFSADHGILSPSMSDATRLNHSGDHDTSADPIMRRDEVIHVQVLEQDDNWGETATALTNGMTEVDYGNIDPEGGPNGMEKWKVLDTERGMAFRCRRHLSSLLAAFLALVAFVSPVLMICLPHFGALGLRDHQMICEVECEGKVVTLAFKLLALILGVYAVFYRQKKATQPRIHLYRALIATITVLSLIAFWLFYASHISRERERVMYKGLVEFALNLVDCLFFILFLAVLLLKIRGIQSQYYVKVVRSPDGESHGFRIGEMSVQDAASYVLEQYYTHFPIYNPYLDRITNPGAKAGRRGIKVYDVDGHGANINDGNSTVVSVASKGRSVHTDRFHDEFDHDRKVRKRRTRLVAATEEAFTHIKRMGENQHGSEKKPMESFEAAQAIFPTISRPLQKYLRVTRQQPRHTMESILEHLATCLSYDMSPRTFLEKFLVTSPVLQNDREIREVQHWSLVSEKSLYRDIQAGSIFQLRQGDISLLCQVQKLPHFNMAEEIIEPKSNRFVLKLNSETSV